jgi:hypothetical protein
MAPFQWFLCHETMALLTQNGILIFIQFMPEIFMVEGAFKAGLKPKLNT